MAAVYYAVQAQYSNNLILCIMETIDLFQTFLQGKASTVIFQVLLSNSNVAHHCVLSGLTWPHGANSEYALNRKTLALQFWFSPAQLPTSIQVSKMFWLMEHFTGRPTVKKKVRRKVRSKEIIAFAVLPAFAKPRRIRHQEPKLVDFLSSFFGFVSLICISAFSFPSKALTFPQYM